MARHSLRLACRKRLTNVSSPAYGESVLVDNRCNESASMKKVRQEPCIRSMKKVNEQFVSDEDHIYSLPKEQKNQISNELNSNSEQKISMIFDSYQRVRRTKCNEQKNENSLLSVKRQKCTSRNAVNARLNRERKKQYITLLEKSNEDLKSKNHEILQKISKQKKIITTLQYEVLYLKSLLANSKEISQIFTSLKNSTGLPVSSSLEALTSDRSSKTGNLSEPEGIDEDLAKNQVAANRIRTVTSGVNFPIIQDVNLGNYLDLKNNEENELSTDWEDESKDNYDLYGDFFENDCYLGSSDLNIPFESLYDEDTLFKDKSAPDVFNNDILTPNVGLCLHVNNKRISIELCSLCSNRSQICN